MENLTTLKGWGASRKHTFASLSVDQRYAVVYRRDYLRLWNEQPASTDRLTAYIAGDEE